MASMPLEGLLSLGFAYCYKLSFHVLFRESNSDPFLELAAISVLSI
jgi:hypothetical protein